jgi:hypothetical protein
MIWDLLGFEEGNMIHIKTPLPNSYTKKSYKILLKFVYFYRIFIYHVSETRSISFSRKRFYSFQSYYGSKRETCHSNCDGSTRFL